MNIGAKMTKGIKYNNNCTVHSLSDLTGTRIQG